MRAKYLIGLGVILGALAYLIFGGLGQNLVYFLTPSEYLQDQGRYQNRPVRLGGLVKQGTVHYDKDQLELRFILTDGVAEVPVVHKGTPPGHVQGGAGGGGGGPLPGRGLPRHQPPGEALGNLPGSQGGLDPGGSAQAH